MRKEAIYETLPSRAFEDMTLSALVTQLLDKGYSFDRIKLLTITEIYGIIEKKIDADEYSMTHAA